MAPSVLSNPDPSLDAEGLLHDLFRSGERPAVECQGRTLSYRELEEAANRFSRLLQSRGVARGSRVCILLSKSFELYAAILGTLKAGAAYVPLDPSYPPDRIGFIASDSRAALLVSSLEFLDAAGAAGVPRLFVDEVKDELESQDPSALSPQARPEDEAYVIYTSGTTGRPKGVPIAHRAAHHLIRAEQKFYGVRAEDRVLQGFSVAFDASIEEIWIAFNAGATLVAGTPAVMHAGPDLGRVLAGLRITVLSCVPTLLSLLREPVASVRLLILGGEALSADLVAPWFSPDRRIYNTYGPTETTVVATYSLCRPGRKIVIGKPIANYTACVLDESGAVIEKGQEGELAIGGRGVARGYLNREDLTRERFIGDPPVYRTGDLVRVNEEDDLEYLGRIDTQVKIRGFRVELGEIESLLRQLPGVANAAAVLQDGVLRAYVVASGFDEKAALKALKERLPPYMVPAGVAALDAFPTLTSGKVDRNAFPKPERRQAAAGFDSPHKNAIHDRWARLLAAEAIGEDDNFFSELGAHSLLAAQFVSEMRLDARYAGLSMRDVYTHPTIRALAAHLEKNAPLERPKAAAYRRLSSMSYGLGALLQAGMVYVVIAVFALQWITPFAVYSFLKAYEFSFWEALLGSLGSLLFVYPAMLFLGIAAKWMVLGRLKEGDHPIWGSYYLRWLFVQRLLSCVPVHFLSGSPLFPVYLRLLGSKVGKDAHIDSHLLSGLDLLSIGERSSINSDANISCYCLEDGLLKIRPVEIGADVSIGIRAVVGQGAVIEDGAVIDDMTCIRGGARVGAGERWSGSPASRAEARPRPRAEASSSAGEASGSLFYSLSFFVLPVLSLLPVFPGIMLMYELDYRTEDYAYLWLAPVIGLIFVLLSALQTLALKRLVLGTVAEGRHPVKSAFYRRKWFVDKLIEASLDTMQTLYATLYLNVWFRALGVSVGPRAEVSTAYPIVPDLLSIGEGAFIADGAGLGSAKVEGGSILLAKTEIGARTFIGNSAYVPAGSRLGANCLVGCQSTVPGDVTPEATSWVGSPAVLLPQRQKPRRQFAEERTYRPTRALYAQRLFIEFLRVILPSTAFVAFTTLILSFSVQIEDALGPWMTLAAFPLLYIALGVAAALLTALMKALLVGRYKPGEHPLWSGFVWRTELVTGFCENFTNELFVQHLLGTAFLPWYFRLLGMTIGRRACLLTTDFTEFDLVRLGDDVALNEESTIQTHLFEDRVMKVGEIAIGSRVSVGSFAVVLYGSALEDDVKVGDLSLVMKGERLLQGTSWAGSPVKIDMMPPPR